MIHITGKDFHIDQPTRVAIGSFDGLHRGHARLIGGLDKAGVGGPKAALTFVPHPASVLGGGSVKLLLTPKEKAHLLERMGLDYFIEYPFTLETAAMEPKAFVREVLAGRLNCNLLAAGEDYRFGRNRAGDIGVIKAEGIRVISVPHLMEAGRKISSTDIRGYIAEKNFDAAARNLARPYFIMGRVEEGRRIGRKLGFPTVNILPRPEKLLPPDGVYATRTVCAGKIYDSVTNIGANPTVSGAQNTVETYMLGFGGDAYGQVIRVDFYKWLRVEIKFGSVDELKEQIERDRNAAIHYFAAAEREDL